MEAQARAILLLTLAAFVSAGAFRICDAMLPQLAADFSSTTGVAAYTATAFAVAYGVLQMFFGPLGDRYGKYRVIAVATLLCAVGSAASALAPTLETLVAARAISGAAGAGIVPLSMAWIGDTVTYERRQATLARFLTGTILGMSLGQLLGGLFADTVGWRWAFATLVIGYLAVGLLLRREVRRQAAAGTQRLAGHTGGFLVQARLVWGTPWARVVLFTVFLEGFLVFGALAFAPSYLHHRFQISLTGAGAVVAVYALGGIAYTLVAQRLVSRLGERGLAAAGGLVLSLAFVLYLYGPMWHVGLLAGVLAGFGYYLLHATLQTNATQMVASARGSAVGWFASCLFLGQAVGISFAGLMVDSVGSAWMFGMSALLLPLVGGGFAWALHRRRLAAMAQAASAQPGA